MRYTLQGFKPPLGYSKRHKFSATSVIAAGGEDFEIKSVTLFNTIEKYNINVIGSSNTSFGTLAATREYGAAAASQKYGGRWLYLGGSTDGSVSQLKDTVYYISAKTGGASTSWGTLSIAKGYNSACANAFEAHLIGGIYIPGGFFTDIIEKLWIMNNGSRVSFGTVATASPYARGDAYATQSMMYVINRNFADQIEVKAFKSDSVMKVFSTIMTPSNTYPSFCCNDTLGLTIGGYDGSVTVKNISQMVLKNIAKAVAFGELITGRMGAAAGCSQTRALSIKGSTDGGTVETNSVEYIQFKSKANAKAFGSLGIAKWNMDAYGAG